MLDINSNAQSDPILLADIATARHWLEEIKRGRAISDIAAEQGRSIRQLQRHLELAFLSSKLVQKIVEGRQPAELTSRQLVRTTIPMNWNEQHQVFAFT